MPVIHIYTPEGFLSPSRKKLMVERVTKAAVEPKASPPPIAPTCWCTTFPTAVGAGKAT